MRFRKDFVRHINLNIGNLYIEKIIFNYKNFAIYEAKYTIPYVYKFYIISWLVK